MTSERRTSSLRCPARVAGSNPLEIQSLIAARSRFVDRGLRAIDDFSVLAGALPQRALRLVKESGLEHRDQLRDNWDRARRHDPLQRIEALR
jgi:hypothetical protein